MEKFKKLVIIAFLCSWALFIPSLASATLITGSSTGTSGLLISASADFTFTTHDFGSGPVNAFQIILTNTSNTSPNTSPTTLRGNLLTGIFWSFATTPTALDTAATGFDGLASTVYTSSTTKTSNVDIAPATTKSGLYTLNNFYQQSDTIDNAVPPRDWSAYDYAIGTVGYGLGGFNGSFVDGDDYGIFATGSDLTGTTSNINTVFPSGLIDTSATFWIRAPTGVTSLPEITNFAFAYGSLPDNQVVVDVAKVPEPMTLILYGLGFAGAGLYRHLRRKPK